MKRIWPLSLALALFAITSTPARAQSIYTPFAFTNFAGDPGGTGNADGIGTQARFNNPFDVAVDGSGNLYVADAFNSTIRKMTPSGTNWIVTTLAGSPRNVGNVDATNSVARFNVPAGVAPDGAGNVYVADQQNYTIRKVTPQGVVTTIAGSSLQSGSKDGSNSVARFFMPAGIAVDSATNLYVADSGNRTIRKITPIGTNWAVTTIAGTAGQSGSFDGTNGTTRFGVLAQGPPSVAVDSAGDVYVADVGNSTIRKLTPVGTNWVASTIAGSPGQIGTRDATNDMARFFNPWGITVDNVGNLYVDDGDNLVRKITPMGTNWVVTTLAGDTAFGYIDAVGIAAEFNFVAGMSVDSFGNIYVADQNNDAIRKIAPDTTVTTIAGTPPHYSTNDGVGNMARFYLPFGVVVDSSSNVYIGDQGNNIIRKITPGGVVTTIAGDFTIPGGGDGTNTHALFRQPSALGMDPSGSIYVADAGNSKIRRVLPVGTNWSVRTLAGGVIIGTKDGSNGVAQFRNPYGLAVDSATNIYVADTGNHTIRRISQIGTNWAVTTLAGQSLLAGGQDGSNKVAQFNSPYGIAVDSATNLYVADYNNMAIRKVSPVGTNWVVTTIAGTLGFFGSADGTNGAARFLFPQGITVDPGGNNLYVSDGGNATIRRVSRSGTNWVVTTLGGAARPGDGVGQAGAADGAGSTARLNNPWGLALDPGGNLFIADAGENRIVEANPLFLFDPSAMGFRNESFYFRLTGPPGSNTILEVSSNFVNWTPVQTNGLPPTGFSGSVPNANSTGFFRARLTP